MSDWHEGPTSTFQTAICRCKDGLHVGVNWVGAVDKDLAPVLISDHAKAALLDDAVKALEAIDRMVGNPYIAVYDIVRDIRAETDAILTRLRDVPVHEEGR